MPVNKEKEVHEINNNVFSSANYTTNFTPGKKGGVFELAMGGKLTIPEAVLNKKDIVTCGAISTYQRLLYAPKLNNEEQLHSEIFKLDTSYNQTKHPIFLQIPYEEIDHRIYEINVRGLWAKEEEWVNVGFLTKKYATQTYAELTLHRGGVFVVTYLRKKETFELTPNGCLYSSRLCRFCTLRCPRKAVDTTVSCSLKIIPISAEKVLYCQENYPFKCADLLDCVEMVDVSSNQTADFRRPITIKMPIPNEGNQQTENESEEPIETDVCVVRKESDDIEWTVLESSRISRRMVSFDVKRLGIFCVVKVKEGRHRRMKEAVTLLEEKSDKVPGCISLFTSFEEKLWTAVVACYPKADAHYHEEKWENQYFQKVNPMAKKEPEKTTHFDIPGKRHEFYKYNDPEFYDGLTWTIKMEGDLKFTDDTENENRIRFYSCLKEHYFVFKFEPGTNYIRPLIAQVTVTPDDVKDDEERSKLAGLFTLEVSLEHVDSYFHVELPDEVEVEPVLTKKLTLKRSVHLPPVQKTIETPKVMKTPVSNKTRKVSINGASMDRLTKAVRTTKTINRESRVLSGRSLTQLSRVVPNGLNLAIHLGLSESCVTGLGFDALANGLTMNDITYKILLYWKRHQTDKFDGAVNQLALAFQQMNLPEIATVIMRRHADGLEINRDCFAFVGY